MNLKRQTWLVIFITAAVLIGLSLLLIFLDEPGNQDFYDAIDDQMPTDDGRRDDTDLTEASCSNAGGTWNPCGSACRTDPDAICIELCVEYCECQSDAQCPSGYTCGDVVEGIGVCF